MMTKGQIKWREKAKPNRLTEEQRGTVRWMHKSGCTMTSIAELYSVSISTISRIVNERETKKSN